MTRECALILQQLQRDFKDVFTRIGLFDRTFSLQVKPDSKPYKVSPWHVAYALQKSFNKELEGLQQQDIITTTAEWFNSFVLVPNPNGKVRVCLDLARLNQALRWMVHRAPTLIDIFPKLNNSKYLSLIVTTSGCHDLKLDERSLYLTTFAFQFGR